MKSHDYVRAVVAQENQKLARIQIVDALQTVVEAFENDELQETMTRSASVYLKAKAALAREFEARL
jgi:glycyl-tRNA synthetase beta subunit